MCNFASFDQSKSGKCYDLRGLTQSHRSIELAWGLDCDKVNKQEWTVTGEWVGWRGDKWQKYLVDDSLVFEQKASHLNAMKAYLMARFPDEAAYQKAKLAERPDPRWHGKILDLDGIDWLIACHGHTELMDHTRNRACGNAKVETQTGDCNYACGNATVETQTGDVNHAYDSATVETQTGDGNWGYDSATVENQTGRYNHAYDSARVETQTGDVNRAGGNATVETQTGGHNWGYDSATVENQTGCYNHAYDSATVGKAQTWEQAGTTRAEAMGEAYAAYRARNLEGGK